MSLKTIFTRTSKDESLAQAVETARAAVVAQRDKAVAAQTAAIAAADAAKDEHARLAEVAATGETVELSELRRLEVASRDAAQMAEFAQSAVDAAEQRYADAKQSLASYRLDEAKRIVTERLKEFARVVTTELAPAYREVERAHGVLQQLGGKPWTYLPPIESLINAAAEMARPAPATPAPVDAMRVVKFILPARVERTSGAGHTTSYAQGDEAGFDVATCVRLVAQGKAEWLVSDERQSPLVAAEIERMERAATPKKFESYGFLGRPEPSYLGDGGLPSSEVGPARSEAA
jgi:hypothetical protein